MVAVPRLDASVAVSGLRPGIGRGPRRSQTGRAPRALILLLAAAAAAGGCGEPAGGLDDDTYVAVMARLNYARERYQNTAEDDSARAAVLAEFGVSGGQIEAFTERHGDDPQRMSRLWDQILREVEVLHGVVPPESQLDGDERRAAEGRSRR